MVETTFATPQVMGLSAKIRCEIDVYHGLLATRIDNVVIYIYTRINHIYTHVYNIIGVISQMYIVIGILIYVFIICTK